ncbi:hypothetical protein GCM10008014_59890 [Paenibacillus silvae]|uniref:Uncharacterized protein n=2 Tax=Paenibacillus TaxID=44249 RepID=A0ABQ1ZPM1_9BACL|nr:hypothetical protein GCM10010917_43010 [Paenibacillus physcomitrellae]GGE14955.1 hypothetical protein GCM10008012_66790 [Rhizobium anhuiense]GGH73012.1 hypothetical protein GCM10008014_59890 [Paenibacillus silvae]GGJ33048.1 hypothetical protein GCM10008022_47190 [Paenibacillus hunanensis]
MEQALYVLAHTCKREPEAGTTEQSYRSLFPIALRRSFLYTLRPRVWGRCGPTV